MTFVGVEYTSIRKLARDIGRMPVFLAAELRPQLRVAGNLVADQVKANAATFSTRIPGAVSVSSRLTATGGVYVRVSSKLAPHARPIEGSGGNLSFRHPVFPVGDDRGQWTWVSQPTHPFFFPAVKAKRPEAMALIANAVRSATRIRT
jgi:hypothetical protein